MRICAMQLKVADRRKNYCPTVAWSFSLLTVKEVENCVGKFLRTVGLGLSNTWSDEERYLKNVLEFGWNS